MMFIRTLILSMCIVWCATASARPPKGFHTGPYLQLLFGGVDASFDHNQVSNTSTGRDEELALGFLFGWHVSDIFGPFMEIRYSTDDNGGNRLHIVNGNIGATYTLILDALTNFKSLRILPYLGGDMIFQVGALPSDPTAGTGTVDRYAIGPGVLGGVNFLFKRYVYIGLMGQYDFPYFFSRSQTIGGIDTTVYGSGWHPQWGATLNAGFHF